MKNIFISIILLTFSVQAQDNYKKWVQEQNIPPWIHQLIKAKTIDPKYAISYHINPFYLRADLNGDGRLDIAILIINKKSGKKGIAICHSDSNEVFILGAGKKNVNGGDDFNWMNIWYVSSKTKILMNVTGESPPVLKGEALFVEKSESASSLIYWDGKNYQWYQQAD